MATASVANPDVPSSTCPPPLAPRADGPRLDVDWSFIAAREGGAVLAGYVPDAAGSQSGVTIGTGVDLGQRNAADLRALAISAALCTQLTPYCGLKSQAAAAFLRDHPLAIADADAQALDTAIKLPLLARLAAAFDAAVDAANAADGCRRVHFTALPGPVQTALASIDFQYGSLAGPAPLFWKQVTQQRWRDASDNLKHFGDAYPTRRKLEAGLIDAALAAVAATPA